MSDVRDAHHARVDATKPHLRVAAPIDTVFV